MRHHPDREAVLGLIEPLLKKRLFRGWRVDGVHYDVMMGAYDLVCTNGQITVSVHFMDEWIDQALDSGDVFKRRRIKHALKDAFKIEEPDEDAD